VIEPVNEPEYPVSVVFAPNVIGAPYDCVPPALVAVVTDCSVMAAAVTFVEVIEIEASAFVAPTGAPKVTAPLPTLSVKLWPFATAASMVPPTLTLPFPALVVTVRF